MIVSDKQAELGQIDLDNILSVLVTSRGASFTSSLIIKAAERNIPIIVCNERFHPVSLITPLIHHNDQHARYEAQAITKKGIKNKLWQWIIVNKIKNQFQLLKLYNSDS
jgi:CRISP-associated protein Cas1